MRSDQIVKSAQIVMVLMVAVISHEGISSADDSDGKAVLKVSLWVLARTALLLRTEMSILRDDKMRPLFKEAIVTKLEVTQSTTRYQMKATSYLTNDTP